MAIRRLDSLGYLLGLVTRSYDKRLLDSLSKLGVAPGQFPALVMLYEKDGLTRRRTADNGQYARPHGAR
jgi:hypothetical protein